MTEKNYVFTVEILDNEDGAQKLCSRQAAAGMARRGGRVRLRVGVGREVRALAPAELAGPRRPLVMAGTDESKGAVQKLFRECVALSLLRLYTTAVHLRI